MHGIERNEINELNQLDVTAYLKEYHADDFLYRSNGCMVSKDKSKRRLVIYPKTDKDPSHGFYFGKSDTKNYKDNISVIQMTLGYDFMRAVNVLRAYRDSNGKIPNYNEFD